MGDQFVWLEAAVGTDVNREDHPSVMAVTLEGAPGA